MGIFAGLILRIFINVWLRVNIFIDVFKIFNFLGFLLIGLLFFWLIILLIIVKFGLIVFVVFISILLKWLVFLFVFKCY